MCQAVAEGLNAPPSWQEFTLCWEPDLKTARICVCEKCMEPLIDRSTNSVLRFLLTRCKAARRR
jgi:hypothetical protein